MREPILKLMDVNKSFGGVIVAEHVELELLAGEIHGLIGPNGAGKTTMLNLISGIYEMDEGRIEFMGKDISRLPAHKRAHMGIGRTFLTQLAGFTFCLEDDISSLTFGQRKLLEIIRAILAEPKAILIDEPAAGLNGAEIQNEIQLLQWAAKERGMGILLIEHSMDMIMSVCQTITVLNFGRVIACGTPEEIAGNEEVIIAYLGRDEDAEN